MQCTLPVFEGLLPGEYNSIILDLLFNLSVWYAFTKLCLYTEQTLAFFDKATEYLGKSIQKFQHTTCEYYFTTELPQEHAAWGYHRAALAAQQGQATSVTISKPKEKNLNLLTYKFHTLGDYPNTI